MKDIKENTSKSPGARWARFICVASVLSKSEGMPGRRPPLFYGNKPQKVQ